MGAHLQPAPAALEHLASSAFPSALFIPSATFMHTMLFTHSDIPDNPTSLPGTGVAAASDQAWASPDSLSQLPFGLHPALLDLLSAAVYPARSVTPLPPLP